MKKRVMEKTLVIFKPSAIQRGLIGEIIQRFERKGLQLVGIKMVQLNDEILNIHYKHLIDKPFFERIKDSMKRCPVIVQCWIGPEAVSTIRNLTGSTNGRQASIGTIRGDFSISIQENIVHTSDSPQAAEIEVKRFFDSNEIFNYSLNISSYLYADSEK